MRAWSRVLGGFWMGNAQDGYDRNWSWRRGLNPRPSDYKSDALPTELRQLKARQRCPILRKSGLRESTALATVSSLIDPC